MQRAFFVLVVGMLAFAPPGQARAQACFERAALLGHAARLADDRYEGRATGTGGGRAARDYIRDTYGKLGLKAFGTYVRPFTFTARDGRDVEGFNVVGFIPGTERPDLFLVVTAHFDHLGIVDGQIYNGADDNASGVAALLAAAACFTAQPPRHSILFAALDAEEQGLRGAEAFLAEPPVPRDRIVLNVNLDMVGRGDKNELFASGTYHYPFLKTFLEPVGARSAVRLRFGHDRPEDGHDDWTFASDHGVFHRHGIPYVYFGVEDHPDYHKPTDDFEAIPQDFFVNAVATIVDALRTFDVRLGEVRRHALGAE
ncbi:M28 family peptidase [Rhodocaloribacter litoris]|uniref:M28 family peptidase n=1 Tax=Rhodocaloribacter litoris TaxID=2558931 RepID=UPI001423F28F|nr:M28 family peptidase [Rhodocaloribacter litoris]QXD14752.1 M28 family peptidase [Rhodocaloribacter litoris]